VTNEVLRSRLADLTGDTQAKAIHRVQRAFERHWSFAVLSNVLATARLALSGCAVSLLWSWFVMPIGFPRIGILQSIGLIFLAAIIARPPPTPQEKGQSFTYECGHEIGLMGAVGSILLAGWVVSKAGQWIGGIG